MFVLNQRVFILNTSLIVLRRFFVNKDVTLLSNDSEY